MYIIRRDNLVFDPDVISRKYLIAAKEDDVAVECAYLYRGERRGLCCSAQAGCVFSCRHCATTFSPNPFIRNLTTSEILKMIKLVVTDSNDGLMLDFLDFSGIGDCCENWGAVREACFESKKSGLTLSYRVSSIAPRNWCIKVAREIQEGLFSPTRIVISLHGPNKEIRNHTIPNAEDPWQAAAWWKKLHSSDCGVDLNYVVHQKNSHPDHLDELIDYICANVEWINELRLSTMNPVKGTDLFTPDNYSEFCQKARERIPDTVHINKFTSAGRSVNMACGQMRASIQKKASLSASTTKALFPIEKQLPTDEINSSPDSSTSLESVRFGYQYIRNTENFRRIRQSFEIRDEYCGGLPISLHVEASGHCNLSCPLCPRGNGLIERKGNLSWDVFNRLFSMISPGLCKVVISGWGEPLLNPDTPRMIAHIVANGIPVTMNTNGICVYDNVKGLVESGLTIINIALDGAGSKFTHNYPEGNSFDTVVQGVKRLRKKRDRLNARFPIIHGQFLMDTETVEEIEKLRKWAFAIGVDHVKFKRRHETMPGQITRDKQEPREDLRKIHKHKFVKSTEKLDFSPEGCAHPWESIFIGCNGVLSVCSWDPYQKCMLGTVPEKFDQIWNGEIIGKIRRWHSGKSVIVGEPCRTCNRLPGYLRREDLDQKDLCAPRN